MLFYDFGNDGNTHSFFFFVAGLVSLLDHTFSVAQEVTWLI